MCGIVGYIGTQPADGILLEGLRQLEYRGYDSAGIATLWDGKLNCLRAEGKLRNLQAKVEQQPSSATIGIGHTRWATHGKPEERNAHPHLDMSRRVAVVQNGIIENFRELREELQNQGISFASDTDTEVIPNLIARELERLRHDDEPEPFESPLREAVRRTVHLLEGSYAIAVLNCDSPDELVVARQQAPLVIGFGQGEFFCASDTPAILPFTRAVVNLDNGELARLTPMGIEIWDFEGRRIKKIPRLLSGSSLLAEKQGFKHFMLKEIYDQVGVVRTWLSRHLNDDWRPRPQDEPIPGQIYPHQPTPIILNLPDGFLDNLQQIQVLACGTSRHAAMVGQYLLEQLAGIPTQVFYASEFRYAPVPLLPNTLTIGVTQSGETADTLAALEMEQRRRQGLSLDFQARLLGVTNRPESSITHIVPHILDIQAGLEVGVAATKTFIGQMLAFYSLALDLAYRRGTQPLERLEALIQGLRQIPDHLEQLLATQDAAIEAMAHEFNETQDFIFLGRGINFPIALEGALKLKEISYIHAEGYPAGEMKHGPIALLDAKVPVVAIATPGSVYDKVLSNAQEAKARDARLIGVTPPSADSSLFHDLLPIPIVDELLSPLLTVVPLQLLSYHIAAHRGLDVDQPRNLAKSVTVE
jgi:glutamine---fructose-6-phosphate transaminase (isomerizing)